MTTARRLLLAVVVAFAVIGQGHLDGGQVDPLGPHVPDAIPITKAAFNPAYPPRSITS